MVPIGSAAGALLESSPWLEHVLLNLLPAAVLLLSSLFTFSDSHDAADELPNSLLWYKLVSGADEHVVSSNANFDMTVGHCGSCSIDRGCQFVTMAVFSRFGTLGSLCHCVLRLLWHRSVCLVGGAHRFTLECFSSGANYASADLHHYLGHCKNASVYV